MTKQPQLELCELADPGVDGLESYSPFCLKVHRALKLARLDYRRRHGRAPSDFKRLNPAAQVPVLLIDGVPVADSTVILTHLEKIAPGTFAHSRDPRVEAELHLYEELADTALNAYLVAARWADDRSWPLVEAAYFAGMPGLLRRFVPLRLRRRVIERLIAREVWRHGPEHCWSHFQALLDRLDDRAPASGFWCTDRPSIADVALFAQLHSLRQPLTPWQSERIRERAALSDYLDRVDAACRQPAGIAPTTMSVPVLNGPRTRRA